MSGRIRRMSAREVESILRRYDFQLISPKGSHPKWRHIELPLQVIVPEHRGRTLLLEPYAVSSSVLKFLSLNGKTKPIDC